MHLNRKSQKEQIPKSFLFVFAWDNQLGCMKETGDQFIAQDGYDRTEKKKTLSSFSPLPFRQAKPGHLPNSNLLR